MENVNLPFQMEDKKVLNELLGNLNLVLKDSDAVAEKEIVKQFLKITSSAIMLTVIGKSGVGKTSILNAVLGDEILNLSVSEGITEYRYGAEEIIYPVKSNIVRHFKADTKLEGIAMVDTIGCEKWSINGLADSVKEYLEKSDVILVVFEANAVNDYVVWDILEEIDNKNMIFILSKEDCFDIEKVDEAELRLRQYMLEADISAPIYRIAIIPNEKENHGIQSLVTYIHQNIIGSNPMCLKQQENMKQLNTMLVELNTSFELRKKQYLGDMEILNKINFSMNGFRKKSHSDIEILKNEIKKEIDEVVEAYQNEIIQRVDAKRIKERFQNGKDEFMEYLEFVDESYQKRMTEEVGKRIVGYIRVYLTELQEVFEEATGYFRTRESLLSLEDKFYGTLAESKRSMVKGSTNHLAEAKEYYVSLTEASEELYTKMWNARETHDRNVKISSTIGGAIGSAVGTATTAMWATNGLIAGFMSSFGTTATAFMVISNPTMLIPIAAGTLLFGVGTHELVEKIITIKSNEKLDEKMQVYIEEFQTQVAAAKENMTEQILENIENIFIGELDTVDKSFADFRMSVNIDSKNIPMLEVQMEKVQDLLEQLNQIEKEQMLLC